MMRSVSFVDAFKLEFSGNHFSEALMLGDVDSDGLNELVIGNVDGVLAVFKGSANGPLKKCSGLGTRNLSLGNFGKYPGSMIKLVLEEKNNGITCVGVGDLLSTGKNLLVCVNSEGVCRLFDITASTSASASRAASGTSGSPEQSRSKSSPRSMKPLHVQTLPTTNVKTMRVTPFTGEECDLLLGHTDRCVSVYHWLEESRTLSLLHQVSLTGQVGSLCVSSRSGHLLVSQPGGTYLPLTHSKEGVLDKLGLVGQPQRRNPTSSTEIVGNIAVPESQQLDTVALCTLDGTIRMLKGGAKQWELQVDHSLFSIEKLDVTGSGCDELVACAWDGMTYIVDQSRNIVRYKFEQNVSAFTAGHYGLEGHSEPCLVYTTFSNHIFLYYNITLPAIPSSNLVMTCQTSSSESEDLSKMVERLDVCSRKKLFKETLYDWKER